MLLPIKYPPEPDTTEIQSPETLLRRDSEAGPARSSALACPNVIANVIFD